MESKNLTNSIKKASNEEALDALPISICLVSKNFSILLANKSFLGMIGYERPEILGENINFLFNDKIVADELFADLKSKEVINGEGVLIKNKKGQSILTSTIGCPTFLGKDKKEVANYIFVFFQVEHFKGLELNIKSKVKKLSEDTKNLAQARKALMNILEDADEERQKAELERDKTLSIINNLADGLITIEDNLITLINPIAKDFFQTTEKEVLGKSVDELTSHPTLRALVEMFCEEKPPFLRKELSMGDSLKLEVSAIFFGVDKKNIIVMLHDVTRENFIERMKTEFVSIAAHQLRTPLSAIKWILKMFLDGDMGDVTETQKQFLQKTYDSNERMINLVNDLLNVTKIEEGRFLQKIQKYDLADILVEAVGTLKELAEKKGLSFNYILPSKKLPKISVDKEKVIMAFQNIMENAVFYTKFGKINILTDYLDPQKEFMVRIQDTGMGIPDDQKVRIFSRFFRGATALKTETEGTGLGLFIAKNIIEAHGGKIWFDSEEGKGTTFYLTLPVDGKEKSCEVKN